MADSGDARDKGRREALKKVVLGAGSMVTFPILGQAAVTPAMAHAGHPHAGGQDSSKPDPNWKPLFFDEHQNATVVTLTEIIIPETDTPGAKAALVNRYIDLMLNDEDAGKQKNFVEGLAWIDGRSLNHYGKPFVRLPSDQQTALLTPLADSENKNPEDQPGVRFFEVLKDLTIAGYYSSKIGMERELEYGGDEYHTEFPGACTHPEHQS